LLFGANRSTYGAKQVGVSDFDEAQDHEQCDDEAEQQSASFGITRAMQDQKRADHGRAGEVDRDAAGKAEPTCAWVPAFDQ
jgi:hypothetical protein